MSDAAAFDRLSRKVDKLIALHETEQMINEDEACKLLGIGKRTMHVYISTMRIPAAVYTIGPTGARFYNKQKLMGLK